MKKLICVLLFLLFSFSVKAVEIDLVSNGVDNAYIEWVEECMGIKRISDLGVLTIVSGFSVMTYGVYSAQRDLGIIVGGVLVGVGSLMWYIGRVELMELLKEGARKGYQIRYILRF